MKSCSNQKIRRSKISCCCRSGGLAESISRYLIRRIDESPTIDLRTNTEITSLEGTDHVERAQWSNNKTGSVETHNIGALCSMIGAVPNSSWLEGCVASDAGGVIKTGSGLSPEDLAGAHWRNSLRTS